MTAYTTEVFEDASGAWRFRMVAGNGEVVASSEAYTREADAERGAAGLVAGLAVDADDADHPRCPQCRRTNGHKLGCGNRLTDHRIEAAALAIMGDKRWPTNEELGGGPTGTRDDEVRDQFMDDAIDALAAADAVDAEQSIHRVKLDDATELLVEKLIRGFQPTYKAKAQEIIRALIQATP